MITPGAGRFGRVRRPAALHGRCKVIRPLITCGPVSRVIRPLIGVVIMQLIAVVIMGLIAVIMRLITSQYLDHRAPPFGEPADVAVGFELREVG